MSVPDCTSVGLFRNLLKEILYDSWSKNNDDLAKKANKALESLDELCFSNGNEMHIEFLELMEKPLEMLIEDMEARIKQRSE